MSNPLKDSLDPAHCALCIVDLQHDFASPSGAAAMYNENAANVDLAIGNMERLYDAAAQCELPVFFIGLKTNPKTDSPTWKKFMSRKGYDPEKTYAICRDDTEGINFFHLRPQANDSVIYKPKYSAFVETDFNEQLHQRNIDTLLVCGLTTECCVDSTVRDAYHRDFFVFLVGDACAAYRQDFHDISLAILGESFAINVTTQETVDTLQHLAYSRGTRHD